MVEVCLLPTHCTRWTSSCPRRSTLHWSHLPPTNPRLASPGSRSPAAFRWWRPSAPLPWLNLLILKFVSDSSHQCKMHSFGRLRNLNPLPPHTSDATQAVFRVGHLKIEENHFGGFFCSNLTIIFCRFCNDHKMRRFGVNRGTRVGSGFHILNSSCPAHRHVCHCKSLTEPKELLNCA